MFSKLFSSSNNSRKVSDEWVDLIEQTLAQYRSSAFPEGVLVCCQQLSFNYRNETIVGSGQISFPCQSELVELAVQLSEVIGQKVELKLSLNVLAVKKHEINGVKNIIAVASGKGGVGKSTTAVNLALALQAEGARVGILDADIYGPSIPKMLGVEGQAPQSDDGKSMIPIDAQGLDAMSIGFLVPDSDAAIWRGPMASRAFDQLLNETQWHDLDYLIVDMPPGTGDIQLTLSQKVPVCGAVIVTTPQDVALADATKGIAMFNKVNLPILGLIENMSYHVCDNCGHHSHLFGVDGGVAAAKAHNVPFLGQLPLNITIREDADNGTSQVIENSTSQIAQQYLKIARNLAGQLFLSQDKRSPKTSDILIKEV
ncbi:iron-sulfur cluster carrier protein ApbC [Thalassotalea sp. LPB0316]|uniref:iron-sulfur cluster carrier protein ApbC n=1 Tax=Thalassotalea sp. LPB0316 TaxID=2769490 RepID=UPI001D056A54|nr:iron-sulfur cluster carrier protein ApbC [Thalassotalea sp. LPB0316]